jgi:hypothetical protein
VDYYTFVVPAGTNGTLKVKVQSSGLSLLAPKVEVFDVTQTLVGSASALGDRDGATLTVTVNGVSALETYYVKVSGPETSSGWKVFNTGKYALVLNMGNEADPVVPLPNTQTENGDPRSGGGGIPQMPGEEDHDHGGSEIYVASGTSHVAADGGSRLEDRKNAARSAIHDPRSAIVDAQSLAGLLSGTARQTTTATFSPRVGPAAPVVPPVLTQAVVSVPSAQLRAVRGEINDVPLVPLGPAATLPAVEARTEDPQLLPAPTEDTDVESLPTIRRTLNTDQETLDAYFIQSTGLATDEAGEGILLTAEGRRECDEAPALALALALVGIGVLGPDRHGRDARRLPV